MPIPAPSSLSLKGVQGFSFSSGLKDEVQGGGSGSLGHISLQEVSGGVFDGFWPLARPHFPRFPL